MKLKKIISGGQTGADRTGLECAKELGLETGGMAPKGHRTEEGYDLSLIAYGLIESPSVSYPPRTKWNVQNSDATLWFGNLNSAGYWCTRKAAEAAHKPFLENPTTLEALADQYEVINIAGNRKSTNPSVVELVRNVFKTLENKVNG